MKFREILSDHIKRNRQRILYRDQIASLQKIFRGSVLTYEPSNHINIEWPDLVLRANDREEIARMSTSGSFVCNHWLQWRRT